ncbi:hypothetical protein ACFPOE_17275 [Caenimonas terrae]|uniref:Uncharacterized protein n=1 Tax=Caenimonas terrae TaxID=696074 RepID=A0ABW0NGY9_9BURK
MCPARLPPSGSPPVSTFLDGSLHASTGEFAVLIALREPDAQPAAVRVTLQRQGRQGPVGQWEFALRLDGPSVLVGEADATLGEAPLLRAPAGEPRCPADVDALFTRTFRLFCKINAQRLALLAVRSAPFATSMRGD